MKSHPSLSKPAKALFLAALSLGAARGARAGDQPQDQCQEINTGTIGFFMDGTDEWPGRVTAAKAKPSFNYTPGAERACLEDLEGNPILNIKPAQKELCLPDPKNAAPDAISVVGLTFPDGTTYPYHIPIKALWDFALQQCRNPAPESTEPNNPTTLHLTKFSPKREPRIRLAATGKAP